MTLALGYCCCDVTTAGVAEMSAAAGQSSYDALNPKGRRKAPSGVTQHEDRHLDNSGRRKLISGLDDLRRNFALVPWMVRQHLNYVCEHRFQAATGDDGLDDELERLMALECRSDAFDERQLFDLDEYVRCQEALAVLHGDCGTVFLNSGLCQPIEADRIRDPDYGGSADWFNGVRCTESGRPLEYAIHRRQNGWTALVFERTVAAKNFLLHAYRERFDQQRGVSPVASAYNQFRDLYEAEEYAMVRSKIASLFAMAITRNADQAAGQIDVQTDEDGNPIKSTYSVDFGRGPIFLDLQPGDDAKFLDSNNPGTDTQAFWKFVSMVALKSLDMPYGLFDESNANFFGNKTAWLAYDRSCDVKRKRVRKLLDRVAAFKIALLVRQRRFVLPATLSLADRPWAWVPRGMPWWRPLEEITANLKAIGGAITTPQRVTIESDNGDWYENVDQIAKALQYAEKKGVPLSFAIDPDFAKQIADARQQGRGAGGQGTGSK